jgi:thioredoxin-like negative regulator of GroEL
LAESSNYDLTAIYLENMLRIEPENTELTLALVKASIKGGKYDLALKMIVLLEKDADKELLHQLIGFRFEALKVKYFSTNERKYQDEVKTEIRLLLAEVIKDRHYDDKNLEYWYSGSREFSLNAPSLFFLYRLLEREEKSVWLEECFYLSADLKDEKMQKECLMKLRTIDVSRYEKWTVEAYYLAVHEGEIDRAVALLKDMATRSKKWREELAKFYVEIKRYQESSSEYMVLYKAASSAQEKKQYLLKALQALQYGSLMDDATILARQYEALYYKDQEMSGMFIRLYLGAGALDDAKRVSIQRLKYRE